jgi:hypothetical protein
MLMKSLIPQDTTLEAFRVQCEAYRRMPPEERLRNAFDMSNAIREVSAGGVRARHPDYTEEQVQLAVVRLMLGEQLFKEVHPGVEIVP